MKKKILFYAMLGVGTTALIAFLFIIRGSGLLPVFFSPGQPEARRSADTEASEETHTIVELPLKKTVDRVGSITIRFQTGLKISDPAGSRWVTERPGDEMSFQLGNLMGGDAEPAVFAGNGSEIRFAGYALQPVFIHVPDGERLCFKKTEQGWVFLCGVGSLRDQEFGKERTVQSCLALSTSSDPILREGGIRDLGRVAEKREYPVVIKHLAQFVTDPEPAIRRAAAESLGRIGTSQCIEVLESALGTEKDPLTKKFITEALSLCGGSSLLGIGSNSAVGEREAARMFLSGRTSWVDALIHSRVGDGKDAAATKLISMLESPEANVRAAAAGLLGALKIPQARDTLKQLAANDPSPEVRAAAEAAREEVNRYGMELLMRLAE